MATVRDCLERPDLIVNELTHDEAFEFERLREAWEDGKKLPRAREFVPKVEEAVAKLLEEYL